MHFTTLIAALFAAILSAVSAQSNATTTMFNPACYASLPGGGYTYNSSNPFPISTNATVGSGSAIPTNGTYSTFPTPLPTSSASSTGGSAATTGASGSSTGGAPSATNSGPATQTGAASALDRPEAFFGFGLAALLFAAAL